MKATWDYRAFSEPEHRGRIERAKTTLQSDGLVGCVCTSPELIYYFTGYEAHTHHAIGSQAMVLATQRDEPILILRDGDVPQASETLVVGTLRPFRLGAAELAGLIQQSVMELGVTAGAIGADLSGPTMNGALALAIRETLGQHDVRDCWRLLGRLRTALSEQEIAYLREASDYANAGIDAFLRSVRAGMSEIELAAEIEYAMRAAGSDYPAVPTWMASGERAWCQHAMASPRRLHHGDLVHAEFAGVARRYHCVTMGSVALGDCQRSNAEIGRGGEGGVRGGPGGSEIGGADREPGSGLSCRARRAWSWRMLPDAVRSRNLGRLPAGLGEPDHDPTRMRRTLHGGDGVLHSFVPAVDGGSGRHAPRGQLSHDRQRTGAVGQSAA